MIRRRPSPQSSQHSRRRKSEGTSTTSRYTWLGMTRSTRRILWPWWKQAASTSRATCTPWDATATSMIPRSPNYSDRSNEGERGQLYRGRLGCKLWRGIGSFWVGPRKLPRHFRVNIRKLREISFDSFPNTIFKGRVGLLETLFCIFYPFICHPLLNICITCHSLFLPFLHDLTQYL